MPATVQPVTHAAHLTVCLSLKQFDASSLCESYLPELEQHSFNWAACDKTTWQCTLIWLISSDNRSADNKSSVESKSSMLPLSRPSSVVGALRRLSLRQHNHNNNKTLQVWTHTHTKFHTSFNTLGEGQDNTTQQTNSIHICLSISRAIFINASRLSAVVCFFRADINDNETEWTQSI